MPQSTEMTFTIKPRPTNDGFTLASDALPFPIWYFKVHRAVAYAKFRAGDQSARIEVLNAAGEVIETVEHNPSRRDNSNTLGGI